MTIRYFVPDLPRGGGPVELPETEAHHANNVMRIKPGDAVTLFDGQGHESSATVESASRRRVTCQAEAACWLPRGNSQELCLAVAMPKGDRAKELIERLTELGVDRLVPLQCQRSPWAVSAGALEKWQRVVVEACKQCHRNTLMQLDPPCPAAEFLSRPLAPGQLAWFAHPGGSPRPSGFNEIGSAPLPPIQIAIGPEGGFTEAEWEVAEQTGWQKVGLGERIYRIETAAVILAVMAAGIGAGQCR